MACSKCKKKRELPFIESSISTTRYSIKIDGYTGSYRAKDNISYPLGSGSYYDLRSDDILVLVMSGFSVTFEHDSQYEQFLKDWDLKEAVDATATVEDV